MKSYLENIKSKSTHERRRHAMQLAAGILIVIFIMWVATLSLRFASTPPQSADTTDNSGETAAADAANLSQGQATLIVAPAPDSQ